MSPARPASTARLQRWLEQQRWHATSADGASSSVVEVESAALGAGLSVALVEDDRGDRYQLVQSDSSPDRADHPKTAAALGRFVASAAVVPTSAGGEIRAHWIDDLPLGSSPARPLGADQSNTSVTIGGTHVLKVLRRLQPGAHPEVEVGVHLAQASGVPAPRLAGWYELVGPEGERTVLGVVHRLVGGAIDGWALVLAGLAADEGAVLGRLRSLGASTATLHAALAQPGSGDFGLVPLDAKTVWATADAILAQPDLPLDGHAVVARAVERIGPDTGAAIRTHGDLHLGQTLYGTDGWNIIDFEGEPARPLAQRRSPQSPLRDVAGMLRSLSYAVGAHERSGATALSPGWSWGARAALLDGYLSVADPRLLPGSSIAASQLLTLFELEKALYEVAYERAHRPDWTPIPLAGLHALIEREQR